MFDPASVRFTGPLTPFVDGFWSELMRQRYAPLSGRNLLRVAAHLSRWLDRRKLGPGDLTLERVSRFVACRRRAGYTKFLTVRAVQPLLTYLRGIGVAPPAPAPVETAVDRVLRGYAEYLVRERGLASTTIRTYTDSARRFISAQFEGGPIDWRRIGAADLTSFVSREFRNSGVGRCKAAVTDLRSLLRFLHVQGQLVHDLTGCLPAVAGWRLAALPRALEPAQVTRMLASCDRRSLVGRRDYAVLCLLVRLGLRAGEVAALRLEDIDWRAGEIFVRGKGRHDSRLPIPSDVGKALAAYLRHRPRVDVRAVFLCVHAPCRAITSQAVSHLARSALSRVGVTAGSAHVLRHTAATQMLRHGASLAEVGHVLRHRHVNTTAIYAKVDDAALRALVQPWPTAAGQQWPGGAA